jgi:FO synthase
VPLLHLRARAARRASRITCRPRRCSRSRAPGQAAGCKEALFTLGDQPELRYAAAREALAALGAESTLHYLEASAALVLKETGCCRTSIRA